MRAHNARIRVREALKAWVEGIWHRERRRDLLTRDAREGIAGFGGELLPRDAREARG